MILDQIVVSKKRELANLQRLTPSVMEELINTLPPTKDFAQAVTRGKGRLKVIGEVKQASPSKGRMVEQGLYNPREIATSYTAGGVDAISVLTEQEFFLGAPGHLEQVRQGTQVPLLRKDFIIDPYQIYEARVLGADAVLLIVAILSKVELSQYIIEAQKLGLCPLVEVHQRQELEIALEAGAEVIGINNRNLQDFSVDLATTFTLLPLIPSGKIIISESGIKQENIHLVKDSPVDAVLVGEALVTQVQDHRQAVSQLLA